MEIIFIISALVIAWLLYIPALRYAQKHLIVDRPNSRKLQKEPVPVFGGIVVVLGILIPISFATIYMHVPTSWYLLCSILLLWVIGVTDDIRGVSVWIRFSFELIIMWVLIWQPLMPGNGPMIQDLCGLWGRHSISLFTAIPLSIFAGVGIINSINLIDGVDGYSSGFGIISNILFAIIFLSCRDYFMGIFALVSAAALLPFYMHNVFGKKSKMYIGDGGSLVIGIILAYEVLYMLNGNAHFFILEEYHISIVALLLAILCVPIFDTLRVMTARLLRGRSPFMPDKTHLHHLYIDMGFSHAGTSTCIILSNLLVVGLWWMGYKLGLSITGQVYLVVALGLSIWIFYPLMRKCQRQNNWLWKKYTQFGQWTHFEQKGFWQTMVTIVDWHS